jgi:hypothetical protein
VFRWSPLLPGADCLQARRSTGTPCRRRHRGRLRSAAAPVAAKRFLVLRPPLHPCTARPDMGVAQASAHRSAAGSETSMGPQRACHPRGWRLPVRPAQRYDGPPHSGPALARVRKVRSLIEQSVVSPITTALGSLLDHPPRISGRRHGGGLAARGPVLVVAASADRQDQRESGDAGRGTPGAVPGRGGGGLPDRRPAQMAGVRALRRVRPAVPRPPSGSVGPRPGRGVPRGPRWHSGLEPADYAVHLTRRARGLPMWFSLATHGATAYREAISRCLALAGRSRPRSP